MATGTYTIQVQVGSVTVNKTLTRTGDGELAVDPSLPVAQAGSLSTRTDDDTGTITMTSGAHTIATGNTVDIYWSGGVRYGVTVGTVSGTSVPFGAGGGEGAGDNLPAQDTAVTIVAQTSITCNIDGDNAKIVAVYLEPSSSTDTTAAHVNMVDSGAASIEEIDLVAGVPRVYDITGGDTNVFTGNPITSVKASQAGTDVARTLKIVTVYDATP